MAGKRSSKPLSHDYMKKLLLYERLVATNPKVERKGDTMPYTSVNGNMFSLLTKTGTLALRLPTEERERFLTRYDTNLTEQYGAVMREYVDVPDALLANTKALKKYFEISYAYVSSVRPKQTRKSGKTAAKKGR
jgi:hypothetical protein